MSQSKTSDVQQVLVVEDELLIAMELSCLLRDLGYGVLGPAPNIEAAESLLDANQPVAAILDVNLHGVMVTPIARRLREAGVPFALVTGYAQSTFEDAALADAPRLSKPTRASDLQSLLLRLTGADA